jgi:hypothetical protein
MSRALHAPRPQKAMPFTSVKLASLRPSWVQMSHWPSLPALRLQRRLRQTIPPLISMRETCRHSSQRRRARPCIRHSGL